MAQSFFKFTLTSNNTSLILSKSPVGFQDWTIEYLRHKIYGTVFRKIAGTLRFVQEGKDFLETVFNSNGLNSECTVKIERINLDNKTYILFWQGIIDFSTYSLNDDFLEIAIIDNSDLHKFYSREKIEFNLRDDEDIEGNPILSLDGAYENVLLTKVRPISEAQGEGSFLASQTTTNIPAASNPIDNTYYLSGTTKRNDFASDFDETRLILHNSKTIDKFAKMNVEINMDFSGTINITTYNPPPPPDPEPDFVIILKIYRLDSGSYFKNYRSPQITGTGTYNFNFTEQISELLTGTISAGGYQGLSFSLHIQTAGASSEIDGTYSFNLNPVVTNERILVQDYNKNSFDSNAVCIKPFYVGSRLIRQMGILRNSSLFKSNVFLGGIYENIFLTNGFKVRQYPISKAHYVSFRDFYINYGRLLGLLLGYSNNEFRMEPIEYFYNTTDTPLLITKISNVEQKINMEMLFSDIQIGNEAKTYDELNGNLEFNNLFSYTTELKTDSKKDLELTFRTDTLGIESLKRKPYKTHGSETTDSDNDNFLISAINTGTGYRAEIGTDFLITGWEFADDFYNFRLSRKQILLRNKFFINAALYYNTKQTRFNKSTNDRKFSIDSVNELDGIYNYGTNDYLKPIDISFDTVLTDAILTFLETNPNKIITVEGMGPGFIKKAEINLYSKKVRITYNEIIIN